ncbi:MAG: hypothetical protein KBT68_09320 [bacterium]|nr:hypothetical protein [Candidatus Colisoma equi]
MNKPAIKLEDVFSKNIIHYVNSKVRKTSLSCGFSIQEAEDFRQNLYLALLKAKDKFDPKRGTKMDSYLHLAINGYTKDYVTKLRCPKKVLRTLVILDEPMVDCDVWTGEEDDQGTRLDNIADERMNGQTLADIRSDIKNVIARLDDVSRKICILLMQGVKKHELPRRVGISKTRFYGVVFPKLQAEFKSLLDS